MPEIWGAVVCAGSSLDKDSNNYSLFNCVTQIQVPEIGIGTESPAPGIVTPFELITHWRFDEDEVGQEHEGRYEWVAADSGAIMAHGGPVPFTPSSSSHRVKFGALAMPAAEGGYYLRGAWRLPGGSEWVPGEGRWRVDVTRQLP